MEIADIDPRLHAGPADIRAEHIIAHARQQLHVRAQPCEILAHIARHAARGEADMPGIGVPQMDRRARRAVEIQICRADADDIRLIAHAQRLLFSGETVS